MMLDKQRLRSFLLGGLTGILAGILLAPRSGRETRTNLADRAGEARERGRERYFDTRESVRESFSASREGRSQEFRRGEEDEATVSPGANDEPFAEEVRERPVLRDVSRDFPSEEARESVDRESADSESVDRSEELRRKVRETRERIRARSVGSEGGESRDGSPGSGEDEK